MNDVNIRRFLRKTYKDVWDLYAGDALLGLLASRADAPATQLASRAFDIADAMVEELDKRLHEGTDKVGML